MVDAETLKADDLNSSFEKLLTCFRGGEVSMSRGVITEWQDIPLELLLQIMSLVDGQTVIIASGVCRGWRDAICSGLTHLSLSWCTKNMNSLVLSVAPKFSKLQTLVLRQDKPQLQDDGVEAIASFCRDLRVLDLSKSFKLTDRSLYTLAHSCHNLIKLNISGCSSFSDVSLSYLAHFCRKLKALNLCGCVQATNDCALLAIGRYCNQLQSLNLGWCENVSDIGVMSLALGCPDLRTLDLCGCVRITDESVVALAKGCPRLQALGLYYCQKITDKAMYSLVQSRGEKKEEVAARVEEEGLKALNISQCTALTPTAVQAVCDSFPALHTCSGRHSLIMSGCLNLTSVHCACAIHPHRPIGSQGHVVAHVT